MENKAAVDGSYVDVLFGQHVQFAVGTAGEARHINEIIYEGEFVKRLMAAVAPGETLFDVGANVGIISVLVGIAGREGGTKVHAFEPEPRNAARLRDNIERNGLKNVIVKEIALGDSDGMAQLFVSGETGEGTHSLIAKNASGRVGVAVEIVRGNSYSARASMVPDVVKIDVEGFEFSVLKGFEELFTFKRIRDVFIEIHPDRLISTGTSSEQLIAWMLEKGYVIEWRGSRSTELHIHFKRT